MSCRPAGRAGRGLDGDDGDAAIADEQAVGREHEVEVRRTSAGHRRCGRPGRWRDPRPGSGLAASRGRVARRARRRPRRCPVDPGVVGERVGAGEAGHGAEQLAVGRAIDGELAVVAAGDGHERAVGVDGDVPGAERRRDRSEHAAAAWRARTRRTRRRGGRRSPAAPGGRSTRRMIRWWSCARRSGRRRSRAAATAVGPRADASSVTCRWAGSGRRARRCRGPAASGRARRGRRRRWRCPGPPRRRRSRRRGGAGSRGSRVGGEGAEQRRAGPSVVGRAPVGLDGEQRGGGAVGGTQGERPVHERFERGRCRAARPVSRPRSHRDDAGEQRDDQEHGRRGQQSAEPAVLAGLVAGPLRQRLALGRRLGRRTASRNAASSAVRSGCGGVAPLERGFEPGAAVELAVGAGRATPSRRRPRRGGAGCAGRRRPRRARTAAGATPGPAPRGRARRCPLRRSPAGPARAARRPVHVPGSPPQDARWARGTRTGSPSADGATRRSSTERRIARWSGGRLS